MKALEIHLRSGQTVTVDAALLRSARNDVTGKLTKLEPEAPSNPTRMLHWVALDDVAAVVVIV